MTADQAIEHTALRRATAAAFAALAVGLFVVLLFPGRAAAQAVLTADGAASSPPSTAASPPPTAVSAPAVLSAPSVAAATPPAAPAAIEA
ncbi:MAG TPA: hypothetical protein VF045_10585, partial [Acidimicrobiales bacterium]